MRTSVLVLARWFGCWLTFTGLGAGVAQAAPEPGDRAALPQALKDYIELGKYTELGTQHYQGGRYDQAIEAFSLAYTIKPVPLLLFNIGQAHRLAGRPAAALMMYERFLQEEPQSALRPEAEGHIAEVRMRMLSPAAAPPAAPAPASGPAAPAAARPPVGLAPAPEGRPVAQQRVELPPAATRAGPPASTRVDRPLYKKAWFWGTIAVVTAGLGAGIAMAVVLSAPQPRPPSTDLGTSAVPF